MSKNLALYKNRSMGLALESENGAPAEIAADGYGLELTEITAATEPELIEKTVFKASISAGTSRVGKVPASISVAGELKNSGAANRVPKIDSILQAARFGRENVYKKEISDDDENLDSLVKGISSFASGEAKGLFLGYDENFIYYALKSGETEDEQAGFLYRPMSNSESQKTYTLEVNDGGLHKQVYGAACTLSMELSTENYPSFSAQFTGIASKDDWGTPFKGLPEDIIWESHQPRIVINGMARIGKDYAPITSSISIDAGNEVYLIPNLNSDSWYNFAVVTSRNATATVAITADIEESAALYQKLFAGEVANMSFKIGEGEGNQIDVLLPAVQYTGIGESDNNSMLGQEISLKLTGEDNEIMLWFR